MYVYLHVFSCQFYKGEQLLRHLYASLEGVPFQKGFALKGKNLLINTSLFFCHFHQGEQLLLAFLKYIALLKGSLLLTRLHSEKPKLCTILAFLSTIRLNGKLHVVFRVTVFPLRVGPLWKEMQIQKNGVSSPENIPIILKLLHREN